MSRLILNGKEQNSITMIKGDDTEIAVDLIGNLGEFIDQSGGTFTLSFYTVDDLSTSPASSINAVGGLISISGTDWDDFANNTSYFVYGTLTASGGEIYTGINSSTMNVK